jgi:hypothetical protein
VDYAIAAVTGAHHLIRASPLHDYEIHRIGKMTAGNFNLLSR